ncbi:DUF6443 domain-containing protein [Fulvivirga sediminis]|uniref:DUF6443 domain-containing protein n=1 Tax=Fulvivirga sediminis TaxID=2803949 RepID=A0A937F7W4_9BACT|nr:DUF6443 domain-containing protein [Fulvivirga sediminis]MBL3656701.1 hypothetical protein [Fulvivirga sediminis]
MKYYYLSVLLALLCFNFHYSFSQVNQNNDSTSTNYQIYREPPPCVGGCDPGDGRPTYPGNGNLHIPEKPSFSVSGSLCNSSRTLSWNGTPDSKDVWYWQTSANGTSKSYSYKNKTVTTSGRYYLRGYGKYSKQWGPAASAYVEIQPVSKPPAPKILESRPGYTILSKTYGSYWQNSPSGTSTSNSANYLAVYKSGYYYLRARNNSTGCWSGASSVNVSINTPYTLPVIKAVGENKISIKKPYVDMALNTTYTTYQWYFNGKHISGATNAVYKAFKEGYYHVVVGNSQGVKIRSDYFRVEDLNKSNNISYSASHHIQIDGIKTIEEVKSQDYEGKKNVSISYYDEYKRKSQDIIVGGAPDGKDMIQGYTYSRNNKNKKTYLPYSSNSNTSEYRTAWKRELEEFYNDHDNGENKKALFEEIIYEDSPYDKVTQSSSVGKDWQIGSGHERTYDYHLNDGTEKIIKWIIDEAGKFLRKGYYEAGTLQISYNKDEMGNESYAYSNLLGQTLVTKNAVGAKTYFIYDDLDRLSYILQPELVSRLEEGNTQPSQEQIDAHAFQYNYDLKNRVISYKNPGKDKTNVVYDHQDRPILVQSANLLTDDEKQWIYVKHDILGRKVASGLYKTDSDRSSLQKQVDNFYKNNLQWKEMEGIQYNGNTITKTTPTQWKNSGGASSTYLKEGEEGSLYVKANQSKKAIMVGFSTKGDKKDFSYQSIEFAIYFMLNGKIAIYESGKKTKPTSIAYNNSDIFSIHRVNNSIVYQKNNETFYTSRKSCKGEVFVDFAIYSNNASITIVNAKHEERTPSGYSNNSFPLTNITVMSEVYYDDYDLPWDVTPYNSKYSNSNEFNKATKGIVTAYRKKELGSPNWLQSVVFYDDKYRMEATVTDNAYGSFNKVSYKYTFDNKVTARISNMYDFNGQDFEVTEQFQYDHMGRLKKYLHKIYNGTEGNDAAPPKLIAYNQYDELGRLNKKMLHEGEDGFLQSIDYKYNIKGWLTNINHIDLLNHEDDDNLVWTDFFGMDIAYNTSNGVHGSNPLYNGNISGIKWSKGTTPGGEQLAYAYNYDQISQLKDAMAQNNVNALKNVEYDKNGNIRSLSRYNAEGVEIDQLNYNYHNVDHNKLLSVNDNAEDVVKSLGYRGSEKEELFEYDKEGNVTSDPTHGIISISYNIFNQPKEILTEQGSRLVYRYAADGQKLGFNEYDKNGQLVNEVIYNGMFFIKNNKVEFIKHAEGRAVYDETIEKWVYEYDLKDYQGNSRVSFTSAPKVWDFNLNYEGSDDDEALFENTESISNDIFDHTDEGSLYTHSQLITGGEGSQLGSVISIPVGEGDKISARVYAKYLAKPGNISDATLPIGTVLANMFSGGSIIGGETGVSTINQNFSAGTIIGTTGFPLENDDAPKAFLNLMFLPNDESIDLKHNSSFAYDQINANATQYAGEAKSNSYDVLEIDKFVSPGNGHILIYLSNESANLTEVYFDDLKITVEEHPVIQKNDYYPYGMISSSWVRPNNLKNEFLYNGESRWNETTQTYQTSFRSYDPALGRFYGADALAGNAPSLSPYRYGFNNPVMFNDPSGLFENGWTPLTGFDTSEGGVGGGGSSNGTSVSAYWAGHWAQAGAVGAQRNAAMMSGHNFNNRYGKSTLEYRDNYKRQKIWNQAYASGEAVTYRNDGYYSTVTTPYGTSLNWTENWKVQDGGDPFPQADGFRVTERPFTGSRADGQTYFEGVRVNTSEIGSLKNRAAFTVPGAGIFVNPKDEYNVQLLKHEFGHILQYRKFGATFYTKMAMTSLESANSANHGIGDHQSNWTEWTANFLSYQYFGDTSATWDTVNYPIAPSFTNPSYPPMSPFDFYGR